MPVARVSFVVVDWINGNGSGETYTFLNNHNGFIDKQLIDKKIRCVR